MDAFVYVQVFSENFDFLLVIDVQEAKFGTFAKFL